MSGYYLLILEEGFDDMSLLSCRVILEEYNNDVIIASSVNGPIKGEDSSVMAVTVDESLSQEINYLGIILLAGRKFVISDRLREYILEHHRQKKTIAVLGDAIALSKEFLEGVKMSDSNKIIIDSNVISLYDLENIEEFVEQLAKHN